MIHNGTLFWHTLHHLKPSQILWRTWYILQRRLHLYRIPRNVVPPPEFDRTRCRSVFSFLESAHACGIHHHADMDALRQQSFCFLSHRVENHGDIPWKDGSLSRLWRYHLHGFDFARDFAVNAAQDHYLGDRDRALHWMQDWIAKNPVGLDIAWDAYPVADRLLNWTLLIAAFNINEEDVRNSYHRQMIWLSRHLEYDILGNHLLKNACALLAAATITHNKCLMQRALSLITEQLAEQILDDGGHYERSPMYHACILWDLLVVQSVLDIAVPELNAVVSSMTRFLELLCHPDGEIPLFGDAALQSAPASPALLALARHCIHNESGCTRNLDSGIPSFAAEDRQNTFDQSGTAKSTHQNIQSNGFALSSSGYYILGPLAQQARMIVKTAPPSPDYQPGHSHADLLSLELCVGNHRILVDSGTHGYAESSYREYCRSTRAHNTVQVNGLEQCEHWEVFRIARRPHTDPPVFQQSDSNASIIASYRHHSGYRHTRHILFSKISRCWDIMDRIELRKESINAISYLHFHPECRFSQHEDYLEVQCGNVCLHITSLNSTPPEFINGAASPQTYCYCPEFGMALPSPTVICHYHGHDLIESSWRVTLVEAPAPYSS